MIPNAKLIWGIALAGAMTAVPAFGQTADAQQEVENIRQQMQLLEQRHAQQIQALESRLQALETQVSEPASTAAARPASPSAAASNQGVQIGLSATVAGGGSSEGNDILSNLQRGHHDPNKNGFTLQSGELFLGGSVSPDFDAQAHIDFIIDAEGETSVELEELFFTTRKLPYGLQVKGGQYFTEFGRLNPMHPHQWDFVDQPVILSRLFGADGLRSQGLRLSWLSPLPWYSEFLIGAQNAKGETATSFFGEAGEDIAGHVLLEKETRNFGDLLYSARWLNGFDASDTVSVNFGLSGAFGPNATGSDTRTYIVGGDFYAKYQPKTTQRGFPFVAVHAEALYREYAAGDKADPASERLQDWGLFSQVTYGFRPGWVAGLRFDFADSDGSDPTDPFRDVRWRLSPHLTWYLTDFRKLRLQYNRDWAQFLPDNTADTVWLQFEYSLGSHFAHTF